MESSRIFCKDQRAGKQVEMKDKSIFTVVRVEFQVNLRQKDPLGAGKN